MSSTLSRFSIRVCVFAVALQLVAGAALAQEKTFDVPGKAFKIAITIPNYGSRGGYAKGEAGRAMAGKDKKREILVEIFSEDIRANINAEECQDYYKKSIETPDRNTIKMEQTPKYPLTTFFVEKMVGQTYHQKHMNGYFAHQNVCLEVHVSKIGYSDSDEAPMRAILDSVHF